MGKSQWDPWRIRGEFRDQVERFLEDSSQGYAQGGGTGYVWTPLADVLETAQALIVLVELPGVAAEQVVVELAEGDLVVRGERTFALEEPDSAYHIVERARGAFARRFALPPGVDGEAVSAVLREGLLTITVPKRAVRSPLRYVLTPE
jgi:HSP20 family protein